MIDGAALLALVLEQHVLTVEEQDVELLDFVVCDVRGNLVRLNGAR